MNINNISNAAYIWDFEQLGDFLDDENNFKDKDDFEWWQDLADSLALLEDNGLDILALEVSELQDYINIAKKQREAAPYSYDSLQNVYFDAVIGVYDLEFLVSGDKHYIQVSASDHPEAATDENYFDEKKVINRIIDAY